VPAVAIASFVMLSTNNLFAQSKKPNILVIMGDDVGMQRVASFNLDRHEHDQICKVVTTNQLNLQSNEDQTITPRACRRAVAIP
jgi:hypothetical protein